MKVIKGDRVALKSHIEELYGKTEVLTGDEEVSKGDRVSLTCDRKV